MAGGWLMAARDIESFALYYNPESFVFLCFPSLLSSGEQQTSDQARKQRGKRHLLSSS
jgi:hypothetical protein